MLSFNCFDAGSGKPAFLYVVPISVLLNNSCEYFFSNLSLVVIPGASQLPAECKNERKRNPVRMIFDLNNSI
jgi:hypothetical protein